MDYSIQELPMILNALRHTFATRALEQGMDTKTLFTLLGHYSMSFALDIYTHVLDEQKRQEMQRLEELFDTSDCPGSCTSASRETERRKP